MTSSSNVCSLAIIGDGSVGKSSIIGVFKSDEFAKVYKQTIGCDFYEKSMQIRGDVYVSLRVWDIGGQSIHSKNLDSYIKNSTIIFLVYDITNSESFANLSDWLAKIRNSSDSQFVYIIGNKIDLTSLRQVTEIQHNKFIEECGLKGGMFLSAKTGENLLQLFYKAAGEAIGIRLTQYELEFHSKVLTAYISKQTDDEGRTDFADEIEAADRAAELNKKTSDASCQCTCS